MTYEQELEQQNEELRDRLTKSENLVAEYTRKYSYSDVIDMYSYCKDSYSHMLIELAHKLLDTDKGEWSPSRGRIEYFIEQKDTQYEGTTHRHIFSLKIEKEKLSFIEKYILFRKPRKYVFVQHENPLVIGGDGFCTSTNKNFMSKVESKCAFHMIESIKRLNDIRIDAVDKAYTVYDSTDNCNEPYVQRNMNYIKQSAKDILT